MIRLALITGIISYCYLCNAQKVEFNNSVQNLITKSTPQAYQFQKFGDVPVNTNTGVLGLNIPFFELNITNVNWQIGINYHSSGIKVNELASCVGLGWSLNAGGLISSRTFHRSDVYAENEGNLTSNKKTFNLTPTTPTSGEIHMCHYANPSDVGFADNIIQFKQNEVEINLVPDIFYLNAGSLSAKFFLKGGKGYCLPSKDILIDHFSGTNTFVIVDESGSKYTFEWGGANATETSWPSTAPDGAGGTLPTSLKNFSPTFVLTKIENVFGETIRFSYSKEYYYYRSNDRHVYHLNLPAQTPVACSNPVDGFMGLEHKSVFNRVIETRLDSIFSSRGEVVVFNYSTRQDLVGSHKLDKISLYFNESSTFRFIKAYEFNNGYFGTGSDARDLRLKLNSIRELDNSNLVGATYSFSYNSIELPNRLSAAQDSSGYFNGQINNLNLVPVYGGDRSYSFTHAQACMLRKINYPTGGSSEFFYEMKNSGGLRIKKIINSSAGQDEIIKEYVYEGAYNSSTFKFSKEMNFYYLYCAGGSSNPPAQVNCPAVQTFSEPYTPFMQSYNAADNVERYAKVTELLGVDGAGGKIEYDYGQPGLTVPIGMLGLEELLVEKRIYRIIQSTYEIVQKENFTYSLLNDPNTDFYSDAANPREIRTWGLDFDLEKEEMIQACGAGYAWCYPKQIWQQAVKLVSSPVLLVDQKIQNYSGANFVEIKKEFEYDVIKNLLPKTIISYDSKLGRNVEKVIYPTDLTSITSSDAVSAGIKNLYDKHVFNAEIERATYAQNVDGSNSQLTGSTLYVYKSASAVIEKLKSIELSEPITSFTPAHVLNGSVVTDGQYKEKGVYSYNTTGDLLEFQKAGDIMNSYVWEERFTGNGNFKYKIPIAAIVGASINDVAYTSFESASSGYWSYAGSAVLDITAPTGVRAYNLQSGNVYRSISSGGSYRVSYWSKNGPQNVNGSNPTQGRTVGGWTFYSHTINLTAAGSITVSGNGLIDELRALPSHAGMTTMVFEPLIGRVADCDQNNRITYYEYDSFNRLILTRDQDKRVIRKICYNYFGQPESCTNNCTYLLPDWQNTITLPDCQKDQYGENTGYQMQEQVDVNSCSPTYNQTQWVVAGYNPTACPPSGNVMIQSDNQTSLSEFEAEYVDNVTSDRYTFNIPSSSGLQNLGYVPPGTYTLTISKSGNMTYLTFDPGCDGMRVSGTSAIFYNVEVTSSSCKLITMRVAD